jgi:hypothetical protein
MRHPIFQVISDERIKQSLTIGALADRSGLPCSLVIRAVVTGEGNMNTVITLLDTLGFEVEVKRKEV